MIILGQVRLSKCYNFAPQGYERDENSTPQG